MALSTADHQVERQLVVECKNLVVYRKLLSNDNPKQARVIFCTDACSRGTQDIRAIQRTHLTHGEYKVVCTRTVELGLNSHTLN